VCIDCGACVSACPVEAIYADADLSPLDDGTDRMLVVAVRGQG